jgi:hypothetical protein
MWKWLKVLTSMFLPRLLRCGASVDAAAQAVKRQLTSGPIWAAAS